MKIKIGKKKYPCVAEYSATQAGNTLIRIISETAPVAEDGFILYTDDESKEIDKSDFTYLYQQYGTVKEDTNREEERSPASGNVSGVPTNPITQAFRNVNARITAITPYTDSKKAYYGEIEKVFYGVPKGELSVFFDNEYTVERIEDRLYVRFERLNETKDITIMVQ